MRIVVPSGSPRKNGNTAITIEAFKKGTQTADRSSGFR